MELLLTGSTNKSQQIHNHHHHWLDSPTWAFAFPQKLLPAEVSGYCFFRFRGKSLFQGGVVSPTPSPGYPGRPNVFCQGCLPKPTSPSFKASGSRFLPLRDSRINVAQESWRGHACNGLGRNNWHYSSFVSIHLSARCVPSRPSTAPLPQAN
jgi:hypothetical protein